MSSVFCTRPPLSVYKSPCPTGCWCGGSGSLNRHLHVPHPQLLVSEIKQTFLSTNLAFLLAFGWWAARPHTHSFGNIYTLLCVCVCVCVFLYQIPQMVTCCYVWVLFFSLSVSPPIPTPVSPCRNFLVFLKHIRNLRPFALAISSS